MINEARFGFVHTNYYRQPQNFDFDPSKLIPGLISPVSGLGDCRQSTSPGFAASSTSRDPGTGSAVGRLLTL